MIELMCVGFVSYSVGMLVDILCVGVGVGRECRFYFGVFCVRLVIGWVGDS